MQERRAIDCVHKVHCFMGKNFVLEAIVSDQNWTSDTGFLKFFGVWKADGDNVF